MSTSPPSASACRVRYTVDSPTFSPLLRSGSWMSCALRKSSKLWSAVATARRWRVGRAPCGSVGPEPGSVLVIVAPVRGVAVPVVDVVDVVTVRHRWVPAGLTVLVAVGLRYDGVLVAEQPAEHELVVGVVGERPGDPLPAPGPDPDGIGHD